MLTERVLEEKFRRFHGSGRKNIIDQLRAQGDPALEATVDKIIAETAHALGARSFEGVVKMFLRKYAADPEYLALLTLPVPRADFVAAAKERQAKATAWLHCKVGSVLARIDEHDVRIGPASKGTFV